MTANRKPLSPNSNPRYRPLRRKAQDAGIPYTSARDAHFAGQLRVLKIGNNPKHQRWYVSDPDWNAWIESRLAVVESR